MDSKARYWGTWLVLAGFLVLLYILGNIRFHQMLQPSWRPFFLQDVEVQRWSPFLQKIEAQPWPLFLIALLLAILLVLLAFRKLEPKDS
ncbi:MAG: hypothetical protein V3U31_05005 [Dehalococcoidia bacterium]